MRSYEFQMGNQCQDAPEEYARGEFRSRPASKGWLRSLAQSLEQSSRRVFFCKIFVVIRLLRNSLCESKTSAIQNSRSCEDCLSRGLIPPEPSKHRLPTQNSKEP